MAGYSKIYVVGGLGGCEGADGVNPILMQIWVGDADRQWLEPHYVDRSLKPIGAIRSIIPEGPNDPNALVDSCITFFPKHFERCPSLSDIAQELATTSRLDFDAGKNLIPANWLRLRREAWPLFKQLNIFEAELKRVILPGKQP